MQLSFRSDGPNSTFILRSHSNVLSPWGLHRCFLHELPQTPFSPAAWRHSSPAGWLVRSMSGSSFPSQMQAILEKPLEQVEVHRPYPSLSVKVASRKVFGTGWFWFYMIQMTSSGSLSSFSVITQLCTCMCVQQ